MLMKVLSKEILGYERDENQNNDIVITRGGDKVPQLNVKKKSSKSDNDKGLTYSELYFNDLD